MTSWIGSVALAATLALAPLAAIPAQAGVRTATAPGGVTVIRFAPGASSATVAGRVRGYAMARYSLQAGAGQTLTVRMRASHPSLMFNIVSPTGEILSDGSMDDETRAQVQLPQAGAYQVQVYFMRNEARRGAASTYQLSVGITG